eukprot:SM000107S14034  [mRNA]  locus=s107:4818:7256:- [translate_table: standard]
MGVAGGRGERRCVLVDELGAGLRLSTGPAAPLPPGGWGAGVSASARTCIRGRRRPEAARAAHPRHVVRWHGRGAGRRRRRPRHRAARELDPERLWKPPYSACPSAAPPQTVLLDPLFRTHNRCGQVQQILIGLFPLTPASKATEAWKNGTWATLAVLPAENLVLVPPTLAERPLKLVVANNMWVALGALKRGRLAAGERVLVVGAAGILGACAVQVAIALGAAQVFAVGRRRERQLQELAAICPGRITALPINHSRDVEEQLQEAMQRGSVELVVDFQEHVETPRMTLAALAMLAQGGRAVFAGAVAAQVPVDYSWMIVKELEILGSFMYGPEAPAQVLRLIESGALPLDAYHVEQFGLEDATAAMEVASTKKTPFDIVVLSPNGHLEV